MFNKKDKEKGDDCYCKSCMHKTARECMEIRCICCVWADRIRLEHPVIQADDLSDQEKQRRDEEAKELERRRRERRIR